MVTLLQMDWFSRQRARRTVQVGHRWPPSICRRVEVYTDFAESEVDGPKDIISEGKISVPFWLKCGCCQGVGLCVVQRMLWLSNGRMIDVAFKTKSCTTCSNRAAGYLPHSVCFLVQVDISVAIDVVESLPLWVVTGGNCSTQTKLWSGTTLQWVTEPGPLWKCGTLEVGPLRKWNHFRSGTFSQQEHNEHFCSQVYRLCSLLKWKSHRASCKCKAREDIMPTFFLKPQLLFQAFLQIMYFLWQDCGNVDCLLHRHPSLCAPVLCCVFEKMKSIVRHPFACPHKSCCLSMTAATFSGLSCFQALVLCSSSLYPTFFCAFI